MKTKDADEIIVYVSSLLNDQYPGNEFVRFPRELMEKALGEALGLISMFRPDLAVAKTKIDLVPGVVQTAPEGCSKIAKIYGIIDERTGAVLELAEVGDPNLTKWFTDICAPQDGTYKLGSYSMDKQDQTTFIVSPPVMPGQKVSVLALCVGACEGVRIDCQHEAPIVEYMLYRMLSVEDDSATSAASAKTHLTNFSSILSINFQMLQDFLGDAKNAASAPADQAG